MARTILVTGANRGIGFGVCRQLVERGYSVVLTARKNEAAEHAARSLKDSGSTRVLAAVLDVAQEASVKELAQWIQLERISLAGLVNNAGVSLSGFDARLAEATLDTNTLGPLRVSDALKPVLEPGACVVNVSSGMGHLSGFGGSLRRRFESVETRAQLQALVAGFIEAVAAGRHREQGWPSNAYSVSKALLNVFTRLLARECPALRVNSVCPGWVRTDMGGSGASRNVEEGAEGIVWAATLPSDGPTGGFFRDGAPIDW